MKKLIKTAAVGAVALSGLYVLSTQGRVGHRGLKDLRGWSYAHRGLHGNGIPENSMAAFRAALDQGFGIEFDIHLLKDGTLAVMHDSSLNRTAGADVKIADLTAGELSQYRLEGTDEPIPSFDQVLQLFAGKAPLIIELKVDNDNHKALVDAAVKAMEGYEGSFCMESFDPRCVHILKKYYPHIIRGQLTENYFATENCKLPWALKLMLTNQMLNFLTLPDFVAYNCRDYKTISNQLVRDHWGVQGVTWTLKTKEEYDEAVKNGWIPIFEGFIP